tara:strand:- start:384 stop:1103 length:720 start_codon:yes stop_codon:yes gene_type:complete
MDTKFLLEKAKKVAVSAGKYLNNFKDKSKDIYKVSHRDIKLELDRSTEALIRQQLDETEIPVYGEELGGTRTSEFFWVVDPLDGTSNYFRGLDQCCISIALMHDKESIIGVIYNFNTDELYYASKNNGAYCNGSKIKTSLIKNKEKATLTTGFPSSETINSSLNFLEGLHKWNKVRMFGSAALSCAYVAAGKCDVYLEKGVYLWDIAAGICLVKEAEGKVNFDILDENRYTVKFSNKFL